MVCLLFLILGSVSASNLDNSIEDSDSLQDSNLEVSSLDSVLETDSRDDNFGFQLLADDVVDAEKNSTTLTGNDTELYYNSGSAYHVELLDSEGNPLVNQSVMFNINDADYNRSTNDKGIASIVIGLSPGSYNITSYYEGNVNYEGSSTINLVKVLSTISGEDVEKYYRNDTQYYATFYDSQGNVLNNTEVTFNINGVFYKRNTTQNGTAKLNINLDAGEYIITAINSITNEQRANIITVLPTILAENVVKYYKNNTQYYAMFLDGNGNPLVNKSVSFNINGIFYSRTTNQEGIARLNINLNPDTYIITSTSINGENTANNITVLPTILGNDLNMDFKDGSKFTVYALDDVGNASVNTTVSFNINGVMYSRTTKDNGTASLNINLDVGEYIITTTNEKGLAVSNKINISKSYSTLHGNNAYIIYGTDRIYTVNLTGANNHTIDSANVKFTYDDIVTTAITNNSEATIIISNLSEGKHIINYQYDGDYNHNSSSGSSVLTVSNSTVKLIANDVEMIYHDGSRFNVTLTDLNNAPLVNETVSISINGVTYDRLTNENGSVSIPLNLLPNNYTVFYKYSDLDEENYNEGYNYVFIDKLYAKLNAEDLNLEKGESGQFNVNLTDIDGNPINSTNVSFLINSCTYYRLTNDSGGAKLNINLNVGYYEIITSMDSIYYHAENITNHILVNGSVFTASDLEMEAGSSQVFSVILKDAYANPISDAQVVFTYNGNTLTAATNSEGVASITISGLSKGIYPIEYVYDDKTSGMSHIFVRGTVSIAELLAQANFINSYIESNFNLPNSFTISDTVYNSSQYLYLLSEAIVNINNNDLSELSINSFPDPSSPGAAANLGKLSDYVSVAQNILDIMNSGTIPNYVSTSVGDVGFDGIVYAFTRCLVYYSQLSKLPSYVSILPLKAYTAQSVLDSANTISDLSAYLSSSKNCDVTNGNIVNLANQLTAGLTLSSEKAAAIYNYVRDEISYSFYYDTHYGSVGTLSAGRGNCVDQAHLLIALYRAAGLPARYVHGTCTFSSGTYGHVWAQVLIGDTWIVSDPTSYRNSFDNVVNWNNYNYALKGYYSSISF